MDNLTPLSPLPFEGFSLSVPSASLVELSPAPYSNTKEILIFNQDASVRIFVKVVEVSGAPLALPAAGSITADNSTVVPALGSVHLGIGPEGDRQPIGTLAFWDTNSGAGSRLVVVAKAESGAGVDVNVTYVQCAGGGGL